ncbi:MAG: sigma-54 dependent transcriptional regulator [Elusimicrobia bacterium]|nr:sigma-54 dependent transcriptional regulator [Candidatus Liberimonas magnetica]
MDDKATILVVDDEENMRESYNIILKDKYNVLLSAGGKEALEILNREQVDIVLLDILMPDMDGIEVLKEVKKNHDTEVIMITAVNAVKTAIQAIKSGAYDYIPKPFEVADLLAVIQKALEKRDLTREIIYLKSELEQYTFENMLGNSKQMLGLFDLISQAGQNQSTILISGESGTGKELVARAIHKNGTRKNKPFIAVDCSAIPENLVESELFGHEKGAFTDATVQKLGKFELAGQGTIFLDEIGNLPLDIQSKILRAIESREITRVGGNKTINIGARIITATNIDLTKAIKDGKFREDLYYRLNVIPILVPPLRDRKEDIPLLIEHFIGYFNKILKKNVKGISKEALQLMMKYNWPGNVRELRNIIERLVALGSEDTISHTRLPFEILLSEENAVSSQELNSLKKARAEFEKRFILKVLEKTNWNQTKAAKLLNIHRNALIYKINVLNLRPKFHNSK